jgi:two-component system, OmpR family, phosphate regulon response regulator OmpR
LQLSFCPIPDMQETMISQPFAATDETPHILVIDDDDRIRALVCRYLNEHGFLAFEAQDAGQAREILRIGVFDALVVDVMMPGEDGRSLTRDLRKTMDVPIILLTAMAEADDRVAGLQTGADDYLTKPFDPRELILRLEAILRRKPKQKSQSTRYQVGPWVFDEAVPELVQGDLVVRLTDVEVSLLKALLKSPEAILSRDEIAAICGITPGERTIDVQVTRLRSKLEEDTKNPRYLQTIRGKGYLLRATEILGSQ